MDKDLATGMADHELSYLLLLMHGAQWIMGVKDDPYALLLRAASDDPHDLGRRMRSRGPLYRSHAAVWVTAHHDLAAAALSDARLGPEYAAPQEPDEARAERERVLPFDLPRMEQLLPLGQASLTLGRPACERLRALTRAVLDGVEDLAADLCARRVRTLDGDFDLRDDLARPVAVAAVAEVLGLRASDGERFAELCAGTDGALDATLCPPLLAPARRLTAAITGMRELLDGSLRRNGGSTGRLVDAAVGEGRSLDDALAACVSLAVVGVDMAINLVCDAVQALLDHPEAWERVRDEPACAALAIEETMRYAPPVRLHRLFSHEDVELGGHKVRVGDEVVVVVEAAERDPAVYDDPDRFSLERGGRAALPDGPLTEPAGPPARRMAAATLRTIADELPRVRRTGPVLRRPRSPITRGVLRFPAAVR
ncbi:P450-derived glycosyltranferase activator [Thermomonospora echinospora]|uniref:p450-derived glycosyltranferase activator n=2 Tax=Thermomonospora echinospora TaxID=1992 RepID=A0A1H5TUP8_9ACTN|nr:P450-derived glycosyltranferase activator [Thermomonospora echinospora]